MCGVEVYQPAWRGLSFEFPFPTGRVWRVFACLAGTGLFGIFPGTGCFHMYYQPAKGVVFIG